MNDANYMRLAITEAKKCTPVPTAFCVGAVIVKDGKVISTGYSRELPGSTHAEECALAKAAEKGNIISGGTIYTTLEACHPRPSGKKSCAQRIIEARLVRVVYGVRESLKFVECKGIEFLQTSGITVDQIPDLEDECRKLNPD